MSMITPICYHALQGDMVRMADVALDSIFVIINVNLAFQVDTMVQSAVKVARVSSNAPFENRFHCH